MPAFPGLERGIQGDLEGPRLSRASSRPIAVGWSVSCVGRTAGAVRPSVETAPTRRRGCVLTIRVGSRLEGDGLDAA
jgi:hypothetical protein